MSEAQAAKPREQLVKAAQYVRMSTDHQRYSTANQQDAIALYALQRGFEVVRTYADEGRSGLNLSGRAGLQALLRDVHSDNPGFAVILTFDISRWGRFQDADESAHYEYLCRKAGIDVHYCAEQFDNDGSVTATVLKNIKRAMAAEYSRELSAKVYAGQAKLARMGYRVGGRAGFGFRRLLVNENGTPKAILADGEQKYLQTDRVILVHGPPSEIETVRRIFRMYVNERRSQETIASVLNAERVDNDLPRPWSESRIRNLLRDEKYIGHLVYGRTATKLKTKRRERPASEWVRCLTAFEPIIDKGLFYAAKRIGRRVSDEVLLDQLKTLASRHGYITGDLIDSTHGMRCACTCAERFGGLEQAFALIGFKRHKDMSFVDVRRRLLRRLPALRRSVKDTLEQSGARITEDRGQIIVDEAISVGIQFARCRWRDRGPFWTLDYDRERQPDVMLLAFMDQHNETVMAFYAFPREAFRTDRRSRIMGKDIPVLKNHRCDLASVYGLVARLVYEVSSGDTVGRCYPAGRRCK